MILRDRSCLAAASVVTPASSRQTLAPAPILTTFIRTTEYRGGRRSRVYPTPAWKRNLFHRHGARTRAPFAAVGQRRKCLVLGGMH